MQPFGAYFFIFLFAILEISTIELENVQNDRGNGSFSGHLDAYHSSVELFHKWPWILQGLLVKDYPLQKFQLEVVYESTSKEGRLFTIVAEDPFKTRFFTLEATFIGGILYLNLIDGSNGTLIEQAPTSETRTNDGHIHSIQLAIDAKQSAISFNDHIYIIGGKLFKTEQQHDLHMKLFLGAFGDSAPSIIGCVKVLNFGDLSQGTKEIPEIITSNKVSSCENEINKQEKVFDLEDSSEHANKHAPTLNTTENLAKEQEQEVTTTKESISKIISVTAGNNSTISNNNTSSQATKGSSAVVFCRPSEETQCENHKDCLRIINSSNFTCVCKHGYAGRYCQFSLFARTCAEAILLHSEANPGVYQIDMDGSGPLPMTFVECRKHKISGEEQILTVVSHNLPNQTVVRSSKDEAARFFPVIYKLFSPAQIKALLDRSEHCEQYIRYDCDNAPLNFDQNLTWFETAALENHKIRQMGGVSNMCSCTADGCAHQSQNAASCNCDESSAPTFDEGILLNENAAISTIYLRKNSPEGQANLTLGELKCRGEKGDLVEKAVTLKSNTAKLELQLGSKKTMTQLEFDFKTSHKDIESLIYGKSGQGNQSNMWWISLKKGHRLDLQIDTYDQVEGNASSQIIFKETANVSVLSQTKLSNLKWHRVIVEVFREEIRLAVDNSNEFRQLSKLLPTFTSLLKTKVFVGSQEHSSGFTGCIRNFRVNNQLIELSPPNTDNIAAGCPDNCAQSSCEHNSQCIQNFENDHISCECKNKHIYSGLRCEKNVNKNSDVSFHDSANGYLKYLDEQLPDNPLNTGIVFSVRTDQKNALLAYAHDQFDNFVQIHLSDEYQIVLTLNNNTDIRRCIVFSRHGQQFNDMRWLQIVLEKTTDQITLAVDDEVCQITGPHLLSQQKINAFTGDLEDAILPPQAAGPVVATTPYYLLFVGGLPSVQHPRIKRDRIAYYVTDIPGLLGCMRGLMVNGEAVDLRKAGIRPLDSDAVRIGCYNDCDTLVCHNGGHCTVHWQTYDPTNRELTGCDCSKTSYYGRNCLKDTGLIFTGSSSLVFDMSEPKRFFLHESTQQLLKFAFAAEQAEPVHDQHLTTIYFSDGREFHAILTKNGTLKVTVNNSNGRIVGPVVEFTKNNYTDGYRHFFQATFSKKDPVLVALDAEKKSLGNERILHLADSQLFFFGGEAVDLAEGGEEGDDSEEEEDRKQDTDQVKAQFFSPDDLLIHKIRKRNTTGVIELLGALNETADQTEDVLEDNNVARYQGCLSNVEIDFQRNEAVRFRPLLYYTRPKDIYHKSVRNDPRGSEKLVQSNCPGFRVTGVLPSEQRSVQFPVWEAPLFSFTFEDDLPVSKSIVENNQAAPWWIWLIVLLVFWLILIIILYCVCRLCCCRGKKRSKRAGDKNDIEEKPILNDSDTLSPNKKPLIKGPPIRLVFRSQPNETESPKSYRHFDFSTNNIDRPKPDNSAGGSNPEPLQLLKRQPSMDQSQNTSVPSFSTYPSEKGNSVSENSSLYFTAQEYFPELEEEEELDDYEDVDSVLAKGFDEKLPDVLDGNTFSKAMTTDRSNPSRMSSFGASDSTLPSRSL